MEIGDIENLPGFRRRFLVTPAPDRVTAAVEDDYHCMAVTLHHDGASVASVDATMDRAPWTTCPGAPVVLAATFTGVALAEVARRGEKNQDSGAITERRERLRDPRILAHRKRRHDRHDRKK